jgi:hypothetical protein
MQSDGSRNVGPLLEGRASSNMGEESRLHLDDCRPFIPASPFGAIVTQTARRVGVEPRALVVRTLLQLPRVASYRGWMKIWQIRREVRISAERLRGDVWAARRGVPRGGFPLHDLSFEQIESSRALVVLTSLHYLRSARPDSLYFALVDPIDRLPVTLCSISRLQWRCVESKICSQFAIRPERVWDISRLYSVDSAPHNAISLLLSRVRAHLRRKMPSIELLITAVDPNLGFTGSSCRAANWQKWMTIEARPYLYENGRYVTPRQLRERFGTASLDRLEKRYPRRFEQSQARLLDSMIYCSKVNGETKAVPAQERPRLRR